ncbi:hypothetical protein BDY19DRAFT_936533 [Irpex rosettiformis]|uniref:Uncharacterized protein n=1 Tax=Irpex rosettiformis TaxID=378272 RepID=A0ACB8U8M9_9APHY|nr:hypothetical protein BDY19DRAFT_936533 [Irpex rosettiformis]
MNVNCLPHLYDGTSEKAEDTAEKTSTERSKDTKDSTEQSSEKTDETWKEGSNDSDEGQDEGAEECSDAGKEQVKFEGNSSGVGTQKGENSSEGGQDDVEESSDELDDGVETEETSSLASLNIAGNGYVGVVGENHGSRLACKGLDVRHNAVQDASDVVYDRGDRCSGEVGGSEGLKLLGERRHGLCGGSKDLGKTLGLIPLHDGSSINVHSGSCEDRDGAERKGSKGSDVLEQHCFCGYDGVGRLVREMKAEFPREARCDFSGWGSAADFNRLFISFSQMVALW